PGIRIEAQYPISSPSRIATKQPRGKLLICPRIWPRVYGGKSSYTRWTRRLILTTSPVSAWRTSRRAALMRSSSGPSAHFRLEILHDRLEELFGRHPRLIGADQQREILGHLAAFYRVDAHLFERFGKADDIGCVVETAAIDQAARPREDRCDRVGRSGLALLVLAIVAGDGSVRRLRLYGFAVRSHQHRCHQAQRTEALRYLIGLHVAVVVLAGPNELAAPLECGGDHVVYQPMLVLDPGGGEAGFEPLLLENLLEQVLEAPVISLDDRVLGRQVDRPAPIE